MTKPITDKATVQFYGDKAIQDRVLEAITAAGLSAKVVTEKPYTTKKDETGYYQSIKVFT